MFLRRYVHHILGWDKEQPANTQKNEKSNPAEAQIQENKGVTSSHAAVLLPLRTPAKGSFDALSYYQRELSNMTKTLQDKLGKLEQFKTNIIGEDENLKKYADEVLDNNNVAVITSIKIFYDYLFENIKSDLPLSIPELNKLLETSRKDMEVLFRRLNKDCEALEGESKSIEDKCKTCIDIFRLNINLINHLLKLVANVQEELLSCHRSGKVSENGIKYLVDMTITVVMKVPLPELKCDFNDFYQRLLSNKNASERQIITIPEVAEIKLTEDKFIYNSNESNATDNSTDLTVNNSSADDTTKAKLSKSNSILFHNSSKKISEPESSISENVIKTPSIRNVINY